MQSIISYTKNCDVTSDELLIQDYSYIVKSIAYKLKKRLPSSVELDDLIQSGYIGLLNAKKTFNQSKGASFETYAGIRVRGTILDTLRKMTWSNKESIHYSKLINETTNRLEQRYSRPPNTSEIINELGISREKYDEIQQLSAIQYVVDLHSLSEDQTPDVNESDNPINEIEKNDIMNQIHKELHNLKKTEQLVLALYYNEEQSLKQIGIILNLSEARVCQIHSQAINKIKKKLKILTE